MKKLKKLSLGFIALGVFAISCVSQADSWSYGKVQLVESFGQIIVVRWDGPNSESCSEDDVEFDAASVGDDAALKRGFKLANAAAISGNNISFNLDGCSSSGRQQAKVVQLCTSDCSI